MSRILLMALISGCVFILGCASTVYQPYQGGNVREGKGGSKTVVLGMDVWNYGEPNCPYRIIGVIQDERGGGPIPQGGFLEGMVKKAKENGADAIILKGRDRQATGFDQYGNIHSKVASTVEVIKYQK